MTASPFAGIVASVMPQRQQAVQTALSYIDWQQHFGLDHATGDWLDEGWLATGRAHVLYAAHKAGKSLFVLERAASLAATKRAVVVYLDFEMTEMDLQERLLAMGYDEASDLSYLRYAQLPALDPLDTPSGSAALVAEVKALQLKFPGEKLLVILDTFGRVVAGEENSSDTFRAFARLTGVALKRLGVTVLRLDHTGKDASRGTRGSSAKGDDIDVAWRLERTATGIVLHRELSRMGWVPVKMTFKMNTHPLVFARVSSSPWSADAVEAAKMLDLHNIPLTASGRECARALTAAGQGKRTSVVAEAQKYRNYYA